MAKFNQTGHNSFFGKSRVLVKISLDVNFKMFNFPTTRSISTTHATLVNDSSFSNEGPSPLPSGDDSEIVKILKLTTFKILFFQKHS